MRVLFLTQYFPPETGAAQNRLSDLAERLASSGHQITVLTALPNYPQGEIFEGYRGRLVVTEERNKVRVIRAWIFATKSKSFLPKIVNYLSFAILSCIVGIFSVRQMDIVFVESPPLFLGISGYLLARIKRAKFVLNVSDLWPESAIALGMLRNPRIIRWSTRIEEGLYRRAQLVTGQTQGIIDGVRKRWPGAARALLTNGIALEFLARVETARAARPKIREEFGFGNKLIVAYTGVHGFSQGLETVIRAAELLASYKDIQFVFYGDGPQKRELVTMSTEKQLSNVKFLPPQSSDRMPDILASIDISIVPLKRTELFKGALPSKLFEALGAGVPVVAAVEGEAKRLVELSGGGIVIEPENSEKMAEAIVRLFRDPTSRQRLSVDGRNYLVAHYNRKVIADRLENLLLAVKSSSLSISDEGIPEAESQPQASDMLDEDIRRQRSKTHDQDCPAARVNVRS
jgi:glycosyltransferase involved in cell wall biosynthesis